MLAVWRAFYCNKNEENIAVAAQLSGKWNATSVQADNQEFIDSNVLEYSYEFYDFEGAVGKYRLVISIVNNGTKELSGTIKVANKGTEVILTDSGLALSQLTFEIEEFNASLLKYERI